MKRIITFLAACFTLASAAFAQSEQLAPGIYAVVDETATPLTFSPALNTNSGVNILGVELRKSKFTFKGETSGVKATGKFLMVINPEKKAIRRTPKLYDPFIKSMTPDLVMIIPLDVVDNKRVYDEGLSVQGINTEKHIRVEFQWELVDENTFEITADMQPGEYAFVFKPAKLGAYDFDSIYGFYVVGEDETEVF